MHVPRPRLGGSLVHAIAILLAIFATYGASSIAEGGAEDWRPQSQFEGKFDWVQMTSGEWVKGEIIAMYDDELEFDSDEFDDLTLDWDDIQHIHTSQVMNVGLLDQETAVGILIVEGDLVKIGDQEFTRDDILTITAGPPKEINFWSMKVFIGVIARQGNSEVLETNFQANFKRRTPRNRITVDFVGNNNTTDDVKISDNQRANFGWDLFISDRFFVNPVFAEYFRDPFQNIASRYTIGVGVGYQLIDSPKVDWDLSGGPGYQETRFDDVVPGTSTSESTPAAVLSTTASWNITKWMEFDGVYRAQFVNPESGKYNHHLLASFEIDITSLIDFDISWIWDRIENPRPDSNGIVPEQNDFRTTVGLTFDF